jgi:hypothetical protein
VSSQYEGRQFSIFTRRIARTYLCVFGVSHPESSERQWGKKKRAALISPSPGKRSSGFPNDAGSPPAIKQAKLHLTGDVRAVACSRPSTSISTTTSTSVLVEYPLTLSVNSPHTQSKREVGHTGRRIRIGTGAGVGVEPEPPNSNRNRATVITNTAPTQDAESIIDMSDL